jgi:hypothetical protein
MLQMFNVAFILYGEDKHLERHALGSYDGKLMLDLLRCSSIPDIEAE